MGKPVWRFPLLLQAPMAGVSTPQMAAAVSRAGGLGGVAVGHLDPERAREVIGQTRELCAEAPLNVNLFCHQPPSIEVDGESQWLRALSPYFTQFQSRAPEQLGTPYRTFCDDSEMLSVIVEARPEVVSFHFGLPPEEVIGQLKQAGCFLLASVTSLAEARAVEAAGLDAMIAQGFEAGGHRGCFDPDSEDDELSTFVLLRQLVKATGLPIIAAGGLMDGAALSSALECGAVAGQFGTAFVVCPESSAEPPHKEALLRGTGQTRMTRLISGRPARCLRNAFTELSLPASVPDYPRAYSAGKALHAAAKAKGESGFGAQWAGQGASLARALPAEDLTRLILEELKAREPRCS